MGKHRGVLARQPLVSLQSSPRSAMADVIFVIGGIDMGTQWPQQASQVRGCAPCISLGSPQPLPRYGLMSQLTLSWWLHVACFWIPSRAICLKSQFIGEKYACRGLFFFLLITAINCAQLNHPFTLVAGFLTSMSTHFYHFPANFGHLNSYLPFFKHSVLCILKFDSHVRIKALFSAHSFPEKERKNSTPGVGAVFGSHMHPSVLAVAVHSHGGGKEEPRGRVSVSTVAVSRFCHGCSCRLSPSVKRTVRWLIL